MKSEPFEPPRPRQPNQAEGDRTTIEESLRVHEQKRDAQSGNPAWRFAEQDLAEEEDLFDDDEFMDDEEDESEDEDEAP